MSHYGNYTRHIQTEPTEFDARLRARMDGRQDEIDAQNDVRTMSREKLRELVDAEARSNADLEAQREAGEAIAVFLELHKDYVDCPANSAQMAHFLHSRGIRWANLEQLEAAFASLRDSGLIALNAAEVQRQRHEEIILKANTIRQRRANPVSEEALYSMDMQELRMRADGVLADEDDSATWNGSTRRGQF